MWTDRQPVRRHVFEGYSDNTCTGPAARNRSWFMWSCPGDSCWAEWRIWIPEGQIHEKLNQDGSAVVVDIPFTTERAWGAPLSDSGLDAPVSVNG